jgi:hypothetical protein
VRGEEEQEAERKFTSHLEVELARLRAENERFRSALEQIVKADDEAIAELKARGLVANDYDPTIVRAAREALKPQ